MKSYVYLCIPLVGGAGFFACSSNSTNGSDASTQDSSTSDVSTNDASSNDASNDTTSSDADAAAFTPASLTGLVLWLDSSKGVTAPSNNVTAWQDQSGNGNNATQSTANDEPTYTTGGINGKPSIHFTGGTQLTIADATSLQWSGDFYIAVVLAETMAASSYGIVFAKQAVPSPFDGPAIFANYALPSQSTTWGGQESHNEYIATTTNMLNDGTARQFAFLRTGGTISVRLNGAASASNPDAGVVDVTAVGVPVSLGANTNGGQALTGDIAEIIAVNGTVSATQIMSVEAYLQAKYSL